MDIIPLPVHPHPDEGESLGIWLEQLAKANKIEFLQLFSYVQKRARNKRLFPVLRDLTGLRCNELSMLSNEFKDNFWEHPLECPVLGCGMKFKYKSRVFKHLRLHHDLGVKWHECPDCDYRGRSGDNLRSHVLKKHETEGGRWYKCDKCEYKSRTRGSVKLHEAFRHDKGVKWYQCPRCDYKGKAKNILKAHLRNVHDVGVTWHHCTICDFKAKTKYILTTN